MHQDDALDESLVRLLNECGARGGGGNRRSAGLPVYTPHREAEALERAIRGLQGPLPDGTLEVIYRELMSGSFTLQQPMKIGFLGPAGSHSHAAAVAVRFVGAVRGSARHPGRVHGGAARARELRAGADRELDGAAGSRRRSMRSATGTRIAGGARRASAPRCTRGAPRTLAHSTGADPQDYSKPEVFSRSVACGCALVPRRGTRGERAAAAAPRRWWGRRAQGDADRSRAPDVAAIGSEWPVRSTG